MDPTTTTPTRSSLTSVLFSVFLLNASSVGSIFFNKALLTAFHFAHPHTLMSIQLLLTFLLFQLLRLTRVITVPHSLLTSSPRPSLLVASAAMWVLNVNIGLYALERVNIPMFSTLRRLNVLFVMAAEFFFFKKTITPKIALATSLLVAGSVLSVATDLTYDPTGYALVILNNLATAVYFNLLKKTMTDLKINAMQLFYLTLLFALPATAFIAWVSGEITAARATVATFDSQTTTTNFALIMAASAAFACLINYATNLSTEVTSPLSTAVSAQIKNGVQTALGMLSWGYTFSAMNALGLAIAASGGALYAYFKYEEMHTKSKVASESGIAAPEKVQLVGATPELGGLRVFGVASPRAIRRNTVASV